MESTRFPDTPDVPAARSAYVQGGKVFLSDTATGQVVPLNGESSQPTRAPSRTTPERTGAAAAWSGCLVPVTLEKRRPRRRSRAVQGF